MAIPGQRWPRYGSLLLAGWGCWWLAFFPGVVMRDSFDQWRQVVTGRFDDWHPPLHTALLWLVTRLWPSFGALSLLQVVGGAALVGTFLATTRRLGAPAALVWSAVAWLTIWPPLGLGIIAVWKDTAFALAVVWLTLIVLGAAVSSVLASKAALAFGTAAALVWLLRHNGPALVVPTVTALATVLPRGRRRQLIPGVALAAILIVAVRGPLYTAMAVRPVATISSQYALVHHIAAHVHAGTPLTAEERRLLERLMPLDQWSAAYNCHSGEDLFWRSGLSFDVLASRPAWLPKLWVHLVRRNPGAELAHWRCVTRWIRRPTARVYVGPFDADGGTISPNDIGVRTAPLSSGLHRMLTRAVAATLVPGTLRARVWGPALPLYVVLAALAVAVRRARSWRPFVVWMPALSNTMVWLVLAGHPSLRYQWPIVLLAPLLVCAAVADWRSPATPPE